MTEYVNKYLIEATGFPPERFEKNYAWIDLLHPEDRDPYIMARMRAIADGKPFYRQVRVLTVDGSYSRFAMRIKPLRAEDGAIVRWMGLAVDLGKEDPEPEGHRVESARTTAVTEAIPQIVWTAHAGGEVDWYNHGWYDYTGRTSENSVVQGWQSVCHPDDLGEVTRRWPRAIAAAKPFEMQMRMKRADGVFRWFLMRAYPLKTTTGTCVRWYGTHIDIDEQKRALERSSRIAQTLQDVFLPKELPSFDDLRFDATYTAAEGDARIGGDWYEATTLADGRILLSIGDVAGHGLEASVSVGRLRQMIYTIAFEIDDPAVVLAKMNRILCCQAQPHVTAIVGFIDVKHSTLTYACAGHPPPILALPSQPPIFLPHGGLPLGIEKDIDFERHEISIPKGSIAVFYTDGLTEAKRDIETTERRLLDVIGAIAEGPMPAHPAHSIEQKTLGATKPSDDIAILFTHFPSADAQIAVSPDSRLPLVKTWRFHSDSAYGARKSRLELMQYIREFARPNEDFYTCELILGEILANAVEHAPGLVEIIMDWTAESPEVRFFDTGPGLDRFEGTLPEDIFDENGRGLFLIKTLTGSNVTARLSPGYGTEIQVVLPISRGAPARG